MAQFFEQGVVRDHDGKFAFKEHSGPELDLNEVWDLSGTFTPPAPTPQTAEPPQAPAAPQTTPQTPPPSAGDDDRMTLEQVTADAHAVMDEHGLREKGWHLRYSARAHLTLGSANFRKKEIMLSRNLIATKPGSEVRDTIRHEVAHVLAGHAAGHGPAWKAIARQLGATPEATTKTTVDDSLLTGATSRKPGDTARKPQAGERVVLTSAARRRGLVLVVERDTGRGNYIAVDPSGDRVRVAHQYVRPHVEGEDLRQV